MERLKKCCGTVLLIGALLLLLTVNVNGKIHSDDDEHETILCELENEDEVQCGDQTFKKEVEEHATGGLALTYALVSVGLILTAGLMSGLTIGLMALDQMNLQILIHSGDAKQRKYAAKILPVVERHHHMLVTLLLCNAGAMEALPIFLDRLMSPVVAICISVTAVLFFGEIIPQALCVRYGLAIGAYTAWLVRLLMFVTFPITWPISKLLDHLLGTEHGTKYKRSELKELVTMHANINQGPLTLDECTIIQGALDMKTKTVRHCMTPLSTVFMISVNDRFEASLIKKIMADGHSRLPVYSDTRQNIVGLLLVKSLIGINLDQAKQKTIREIGLRPLPGVTSDKGLYEMLNEFQTGKSHMATVSDPKTGEIIGIITLEDVIEELIQEEIIDETDSLEFEEKMQKVFKQIAIERNSFSPEGVGSSPRPVRRSTSLTKIATDRTDTPLLGESKVEEIFNKRGSNNV